MDLRLTIAKNKGNGKMSIQTRMKNGKMIDVRIQNFNVQVTKYASEWMCKKETLFLNNNV